MFEDLLRSGSHEYFDLKDRIKEKEALISALFPKFGNTEAIIFDETPVPQSVKDLTDDQNIQNIIKNLLLEKYHLEQKVNHQKEALNRANRLKLHYENQYEQLLNKKKKLLNKMC